MRKTLTTAALLLALCCPALAGEMGTPGSPAPPPTTTSAAQEPTTTGATETLTQTALNIVSSVLSLL